MEARKAGWQKQWSSPASMIPMNLSQDLGNLVSFECPETSDIPQYSF